MSAAQSPSSVRRPTRRRAPWLLLAVACAAIGGSAGCGAFAVDGGIFPLPAIHLLYPLPTQVGLNYETVQIDLPGGIPIFGWFIPAENARGVVFMSHGAVTNRAQYIAHYQIFNELGYHVFTYDYQGFGENVEIATIRNILPNASAALAKLQQRGEPGVDKIILYGLSMGTLPTMALASKNPERVVAMMLEGSFIQETLPATSFLGLGIQPSPIAYSRIPLELDPQANVQDITLPKLFLQSRDDTVTPLDSAVELYQLAPEPKEFVPLSGLHTYSVLVDPTYKPRLKDFLDRVTEP